MNWNWPHLKEKLSQGQERGHSEEPSLGGSSHRPTASAVRQKSKASEGMRSSPAAGVSKRLPFHPDATFTVPLDVAFTQFPLKVRAGV